MDVDIPLGYPIPDLVWHIADGNVPYNWDELWVAVCSLCGFESRPFPTSELLDRYMDLHVCWNKGEGGDS